MKILRSVLIFAASISFANAAFAEDYVLDVKGAHSFVQFRAKHLGFSWLYGEFTRFGGEFSYDPADDAKNKISVQVDTSSLFSNHAERDSHLQDERFLNTSKFKTATFVSKKFKKIDDKTATVTGDLTLLGVTKEISLNVDIIGGGKDPWGGVRQGFEAKTVLNMAEFGMQKADWVPTVELTVSVEGCKKPDSKCAD